VHHTLDEVSEGLRKQNTIITTPEMFLTVRLARCTGEFKKFRSSK